MIDEFGVDIYAMFASIVNLIIIVQILVIPYLNLTSCFYMHGLPHIVENEFILFAPIRHLLLILVREQLVLVSVGDQCFQDTTVISTAPSRIPMKCTACKGA